MLKRTNYETRHQELPPKPSVTSQQLLLSLLYISASHTMHCTYNVTMRRVRETAVTVGKQYVLHTLSVCL